MNNKTDTNIKDTTERYIAAVSKTNVTLKEAKKALVVLNMIFLVLTLLTAYLLLK